jgi:SAM-dependent methyltransferase
LESFFDLYCRYITTTNTTPMACLLCNSMHIELFYRANAHEFWQCAHCRGIFRQKHDLPDPEVERNRYLLHQNDAQDLGYRKFVAPITSLILAEFTSADKGLDYGSGTSSAIAAVLRESLFDVVCYDPFFAPETALLDNRYDYIVCCEVMEHFHHPYREFQRLANMLKPNGALFCMTNIYNEKISFADWYYKNDPTHVIIYRAETIKTIAELLDLEYSIEDRLITFRLKNTYPNS